MTGTLTSSYGEVTFDIDSGVVIESGLGELGDQEPAVVDVDEWKLKYPGEWNLLEERNDILDFGYWRRDGVYVPPCDDWREDYAKHRWID